MSGIISWVEPQTLAQELGLQVGDKLVEINGQPLQDIIDYQFSLADDPLHLLVEKADGSRQEFLIEDKPPEEDLGVSFEANVFDGIRSCRNRCLFCFIDQLQPDPRATLLVKDDDYRMSFLEGNYITGTNLREEDFQRIDALHLSPLYVSVHTTDEAVRTRLLGCRQKAPALPLLERLIACGARIHTQIVLCPGINDGAVLEQTITDLAALYPGVASIAIVPVGLTRFQQHPELRLFTAEEARELLAWVHWRQEELLRQTGGQTKLLFAADELYIKAGLPFPEAAHYEDFDQIENGVGLAADFLEEWRLLREAGELPEHYLGPKTAILTGQSGYEVLRQIEPELQQITGGRLAIIPVENSFFGPSITVTGLVTGSCLLQAVTPGQYARVVIPSCMLKFDEDIFLDGLLLSQLQEALQCDVVVASNSAWGLYSALFGQ